MRAVASLAVVLGLLWISPHLPAQQPSGEAIAHVKRGIQARQEQRLDEAVREFQAALGLGLNIAEVHAELGLAQHHQGNLAAAVESFREALAIKPSLTGVFSLLGYDLLMLGRAGESLSYLEQAGQAAPEDLKLKSWLGLAYLQSGDTKRAIETLRAVRASQPGDVDVLFYLAEAHQGALDDLRATSSQSDSAHQAALDDLRAEASRLDPERAKKVFASERGPLDTAPRSAVPVSAAAQTREHLIRQECTQCHKWTPPGILPKKAWFGKTAKMFGLANDGLLASTGRPIGQVELAEAAAYFEKLAPAELDTPALNFSQDGSIRLVARNLKGVPPSDQLPGTANVRLVDLFADTTGPEIVACDMISGWVSWADPQSTELRLRGIARLSNPDHAEAVDLDQDGRMDLVVADLGEVMPSDKTEGAVVWLRQTADRQFEIHRLIENTGRVADVQAADFDADGDLDLVVAEFGWITVGRILYLENQSNGLDPAKSTFKPITLDSRTGTIHVPVVDLNDDGKPDFIALISQHHEAVVAFINQGAGRFEKQDIFVAPHPHWGTSGIEIVDFDQDGDSDVLLTNGDTMDDMIRFKPYQGVAWLENRGQLQFTHHRIGRYYGVMRAEAGDLDGDGDLDVVASSWIPELSEEVRQAMKLPGVVWFERKTDGSFEPHPLVDDSCDHPTLEVGDVNGDGRLDVITGTAWLGKPPSGREPNAVQVWVQQDKP
jgi:tetratricopeptide (TPR) repeat protein